MSGPACLHYCRVGPCCGQARLSCRGRIVTTAGANARVTWLARSRRFTCGEAAQCFATLTGLTNQDEIALYNSGNLLAAYGHRLQGGCCVASWLQLPSLRRR